MASLIAQIFFCTNAWAHTPEVVPPHFFQLKWAWDPSLLFFFAMALMYAQGLRKFAGHAPVDRWQIFLFFLGVIILMAAYLPPIDPVADQLFSAHMIQHLLITSVGVPLISFGAPFYISLRGVPDPIRKRFFVPIVRNRKAKQLFRILGQPLVAILIYEGVFWIWHVPFFYNHALRNDFIHLIEHACMAFASLNFWRLLIDPSPLRSPVSLPIRMILLAVVMTMDMALSAALTYSMSIWYAYNLLPLPDWWQWDRLQDQRLGGLIMWVPGGLVWLLALVSIFFVWVRHEQNRGNDFNI